MKLGEALNRSRQKQATSQTLGASIVSLGNPGEITTLFVDGSANRPRHRRISDLKPLATMGKTIIDMVYTIEDWVPVNPKSPLTLLAECADEDSE
jgi:hypothetical protein